MRSSYWAKALALCLVIVVLLSVSGAFAAWYYCGVPLYDEQGYTNFSLNMFTWKPEDILPTEKPGENYMDLLNSILNNNKGGLNSSKGTLKNAVVNDKLVHSSQNVQGGNLKHLFITEASKDLDFIVQYVGQQEYHVYMFESDDMERGSVNYTQIKVFKTILVETDNGWIGQESQLGYAIIRYVKDTNYLAITPEEWKLGILPQ